MCRNCFSGSSRSEVERARILNLLALIERPDVLPADAALRIAGELLQWAGQREPRFLCEAVSVRETQSNALV
jgi:hypothetical protein